MAIGRKVDKTYTRTHGSNAPSAQLKLLQRTDDHPQATAVQDRLVAPSPEEMRRAISNGQCPFCGRHYRNIATHTRAAHGVSGREVKDLAGIPKTKPICTPELSELMAERGRREFATDPNRVGNLVPKGNKRQFSPGGLAVQRAKIAYAQEVQLAKLAEEGWDPAHSNIDWLAIHNHERYRERTVDRDKTIAAMARAGARINEIRDAVGNLSNTTIRRVLAEHGVQVNFRRVSCQRPERKAALVATLKKGSDRRRQADKEAFLARWAALGKTWECIETLAAEYGVDDKAVRTRLRKYGEHVGDGRLISPARFRGKDELLARWAELGKDWDALTTLVAEYGISRSSMKTRLRRYGETLPDGRAESRLRFH